MKYKHKKLIRPVLGIFILVVGTALMFFPFIPLGYLLVFIGAFLLVPYMPVFQRLMDWLKIKEKGDKLEKTEGKVNGVFEGNEEDKSESNKKEKEFNQTGRRGYSASESVNREKKRQKQISRRENSTQ